MFAEMHRKTPEQQQMFLRHLLYRSHSQHPSLKLPITLLSPLQRHQSKILLLPQLQRRQRYQMKCLKRTKTKGSVSRAAMTFAILPVANTEHSQFDLHFADMVCPWLQSQTQGMVQIWTTTAGRKHCQRLHCWYQFLQAQKARCVMW